jgi:hypothetical protein
MVAYEDAPLTRFHIRTTLAGTGGKFSDGFIHGIIGIVVAAAVTTLPPTPLWIGLLGTGTLTGLFFGAVIVGSIADRIGRRTSTGRRSACDVVRVADVPIPSPAAGQVRVKVAATSVNLSDWECLRGPPATPGSAGCVARLVGPSGRTSLASSTMMCEAGYPREQWPATLHRRRSDITQSADVPTTSPPSIGKPAELDRRIGELLAVPPGRDHGADAADHARGAFQRVQSCADPAVTRLSVPTHPSQPVRHSQGSSGTAVSQSVSVAAAPLRCRSERLGPAAFR